MKFNRDCFYHRKGSTQPRTDDYKKQSSKKGGEIHTMLSMAISEKKLM